MKLNLTWEIKFDQPQNNRDLKQTVLQPLVQFCDPSLTRWWVIAPTSKVDRQTDRQTHARTHTHTHRDPGDDNACQTKGLGQKAHVASRPKGLGQ